MSPTGTFEWGDNKWVSIEIVKNIQICINWGKIDSTNAKAAILGNALKRPATIPGHNLVDFYHFLLQPPQLCKARPDKESCSTWKLRPVCEM